jgi:hypothetical protein
MAQLKGADELRARLNAVAASSQPILETWAISATKLMRTRVNSPSGRMRGSIQGAASPRAGLVFGDYRVTFQDKGTKPHGPTKFKALKFVGEGGEEYIRYRVAGIKKKPFIRRSANEALRKTPMAAEVVKAWNEAGGRGRKYVLGNKTQARQRREARAARKVTT